MQRLRTQRPVQAARRRRDHRLGELPGRPRPRRARSGDGEQHARRAAQVPRRPRARRGRRGRAHGGRSGSRRRGSEYRPRFLRKLLGGGQSDASTAARSELARRCASALLAERGEYASTRARARRAHRLPGARRALRASDFFDVLARALLAFARRRWRAPRRPTRRIRRPTTSQRCRRRSSRRARSCSAASTWRPAAPRRWSRCAASCCKKLKAHPALAGDRRRPDAPAALVVQPRLPAPGAHRLAHLGDRAREADPATRRCTRSRAGATCAAASKPTGAASPSSIRSCPTSRSSSSRSR